MNLVDREKEILKLKKELLDKEHSFETRIFFTILVAIAFITVFLVEYSTQIKQILGNNADILKLTVLFFIFLLVFLTSNIRLIYGGLRKDYKEILDNLKNNDILRIDIKKRKLHYFILDSLSFLLLFYIFWFVLTGFSWTSLIIAIFYLIFYVIFNYKTLLY